MSRSKEEFIKHHKSTLCMPWPPAWVVTEVASFGNVSNLIGQMRASAIRQAIADGYGLDEQIFCSLLHHLCVLRNTAAHHSRLWNRKFAITFRLPQRKPAHLHANFDTPAGPGNDRRIHNSLVLLIHLVQCIEPATHWPARLIHLLKTLDPALIHEMGFPPDWKTRPLWQALLAANP